MSGARIEEGAPLLRDVVVLSDTAFIDGGAASVALRSAIALARNTIRVTVVSAVGPPMDELLGEKNLRVFCSDQKHLGSSPIRAFRQSLWNDVAAKTLERALGDCDPKTTIVHVHGWTKALSSSIFHAATRLGFHVIVTLHDFFSICPNGSLYIHPAKKICSIKPMSLRCITTDCDSRNYGVKAYRVLRQSIQKRGAGMPGVVRRFISVSDFSRAIIEAELPKNAKVYPVRNPVNQPLQPRTNAEANSKYLYLGRFSPEKGASLFAEAARESGVSAVFAGDGARADDILQINPTAQMLGWLDAKGVSSTIRESRALVLPSLWYETYGLCVMEAAAHGVPAIVPDTCAARELVIDNVTGLWFEGGNPHSLARKLRELSGEGVAERMGAAAYERYWNDPPTMDSHVERLLYVYEEVLADVA